MSKFSAADVLELPVSERLQLVEDIWNTIAAFPEKLELTDEERRLIDQRLQARDQNPAAGSPWVEVYSRITSRRKWQKIFADEVAYNYFKFAFRTFVFILLPLIAVVQISAAWKMLKNAKRLQDESLDKVSDKVSP